MRDGRTRSYHPSANGSQQTRRIYVKSGTRISIEFRAKLKLGGESFLI